MLKGKRGVFFILIFILLILSTFVNIPDIFADPQQQTFVLDPDSPSFVYEICEYNDTSTAKVFDFSFSEPNRTFHITLPKNSTMINATMNLTGKITTIYKKQIWPELISMKGISIGNLTSHSGVEIVVGREHTSGIPGIYLLSGLNGSKISNYSFSNPYSFPSTYIGNVTSYPGDEIVVGSSDTFIYVMNVDNSGVMTEAWNYDTPFSVKSVLVNDIEGDGTNEVIAGAGNFIYVLNTTGGLIWSYNTGGGVESVAVGNLTFHSGKEISAGSDTKIVVLNSTGGEIFNESIGSSNSIKAISIGNVTNDPSNEIVTGDSENNIILFNVNDSGIYQVWNYTAGDQINSVTIGEVVDDHPGNEIIAGSNEPKVYAFSNNGTLIWDFVTYSYVQTVAIGNITTDIGNEVAAGDGSLYAFNFDYFPENVSIDAGQDGDYDWTFPGKLRISVIACGMNSEINDYLSSCTPDAEGKCDVPFVYHSDWQGKINVSDINVTYNYNFNSLFSYSNVSAWSRTSNISTNETVGNFSKNISFHGNPPYDVLISYVRVNGGAGTCDFNGSVESVTTAEGKNVCDVDDFTVTASGGFPSGLLLWDDTLDSGTPVIQTEGTPFFTNLTENFNYRKPFTISNTSSATIHNVISNISVSDPSIDGMEFLNVTWKGTGCDITPSGTTNCDIQSPSYTSVPCSGDSFLVCKEDTDTDGIVDFFKWVQPWSNSSVSYVAGGTTNLLPNLSSINVTPSSGLWGDVFNYSVFVNDTDNDDVNISLWVHFNLTDSWSLMGTKIVSGSGIAWFNLSSDRSWVGYDSYRFEYQDVNSSGYPVHLKANTSENTGPDIGRHNASVVYQLGEQGEVVRPGSNYTVLMVRINDTDSDSWAGENVSCRFFITTDGSTYDSGAQNFTNSTGHCLYYFDPEYSYSIGNQTWYASVYDDPYYFPSNSSNFNISITGEVNVRLVFPTDNQSLQRNQTNQLQAKMVDEYGQDVSVSGYNCTFWFDGSQVGNSTTSGSTCTYSWNPNCTVPVGGYFVNVTLWGNVSQLYTIIGWEDNASVQMKDTASINVTSPQDYHSVYKGDSISFDSTVNDTCMQCSPSDYSITWSKKWKNRMMIEINETSGIERTKEPFVINGSQIYAESIDLNDWTVNYTRVFLNGTEIPSEVRVWTDGSKTALNQSPVYLTNFSELIFLYDSQPYQDLTFWVYYNRSETSPKNVTYIKNGGFEGNDTKGWSCGSSNCITSCCICGTRSEGSETEGNYSLHLSSDGQISNNLVWISNSLDRPVRSDYLRIRYKTAGTFADGSYVNLSVGGLVYTLNTSNVTEWKDTLICNSSIYNADNFNITIHDVDPPIGCASSAQIYVDTICVANSTGECIGLDSGIADSYHTQSQSDIGTGYGYEWPVPVTERVGLRRIIGNASGTYHEPGIGIKPVYIYGWSSLSDMNISSGYCWFNDTYICMQNASISVYCDVTDVNISEGIEYYNVSYYFDGSFIGSNVTNSSGVSVLYATDISDQSGGHTLKCNITDDVYYNTTPDTEQEMIINITSGNTTGNLSVIPVSVSTVNITSQNNYTFGVNVTLINTGEGIMYSPEFNLSLPSGFFMEGITCGVISPGGDCSTLRNVSVTDNASIGVHIVNISSGWSNPDSSTGYDSNSTSVNVTSYPLLVILAEPINVSMQRGETSAIGNLTIESMGNDGLSNVTLYLTGGNSSEMSGWFIYSNNSFDLSKGESETVFVNASVPLLNVTEGLYVSSIRAYAYGSYCSPHSNCYDVLPLNITIRAPDWEINPENISKYIGIAASDRVLGTVAVTNNNINNYSFNVTVKGNGSSYINTDMTDFNLTGLNSTVLTIYHNSSSDYTVGIWTADVTISNEAGTVFPRLLNVSVELNVVNMQLDIISPNSSVPTSPINASGIINITVNATNSFQPLNESMSWEIKVGGEGCTGIGEYFNPSSSLWELNCTAPAISGNVINNSLSVLGNYAPLSEIELYDIEDGAVMYEDITPPSFSSVSVDSVENGTASFVLVSVNITDNDRVNDSYIRVEHGGTTDYVYNYTKTGNDYTFNYTGLGEIGDYDITVFANDSSGLTSNTSGWFEVYVTINLNGQSKGPSGSNQTVNFTFYRNGTSYIIHNFLTNSSHGSYNYTIRERVYDILAGVSGQLAKFFGMNTTGTGVTQFNVSDPDNVTTLFRFDIFPNNTATDISNIGIPNTAENILMAFVVNAPDLDFSNAQITIDYSDALSGWSGQENDLRLFLCSNWSFSTRTCNSGTFTHMDETILPDVPSNKFEFNRSSFSAFAIAESCWPNVCGQSPPDPGGGITPSGGPSGGTVSSECGNGICETGENSINCPEDCKETESFTVKTGIREIRMHPGENATYPFVIQNNMDEEIEALILLEGLGRFLRIDDNLLRVPANGSASTDVYIYVPDDTVPGTYEGIVTVSAEGEKVTIPVKLVITHEGKGALSLDISVITKRVEPYGRLIFNVDLRNIGTIPYLNLSLEYLIKDMSTYEVVMEVNETLIIEDISTFTKKIPLNGTLPLNSYILEAWATFEGRTVKDTDSFEVTESFWVTPLGRAFPWIILMSIMVAGGYFGRIRYKKWRASKVRYIFPVNYKKMPQKTEDAFWVGKIAESDVRAYYNPKDLTTHVLVAGATGAGKSVGASVIAEEALEKKIPVIVFDPTAQWTGFVKACEDEFVLNHYEHFGMDKRFVKPYKGMIYEVNDPHVKLDIKKYMNPGEITVFVLNKLKAGEYDIAVKDIIDALFAVKWEESTTLKLIIVFDEVHRLLEKYGGKGGYLSLERACREFRKWGIGIIMCSQVLADFKEAIAGNVLTDVQLNTKALEDIGRVKEKYGDEYSQRVSRQGIGVGMFQHPKYNDGKPYFVQFRPTYHNPHKISNEEMDMYKDFANKLDLIEKNIARMKKEGKDTTDIQLDLKLAKDKLKQGRFRMAKIYITSLEKYLKK